MLQLYVQHQTQAYIGTRSDNQTQCEPATIFTAPLQKCDCLSKNLHCLYHFIAHANAYTQEVSMHSVTTGPDELVCFS